MVRTLQEQQNIGIVAGYFGSFAGGIAGVSEYVEENFAEDVSYVTINAQSGIYDENRRTHELNLLLPYLRDWRGTEGVQEFVSLLLTENQIFNARALTIIADGNNVALFGDYLQQNRRTGNFAISPWSVRAEVIDGKVQNYVITEDSFSANVSPSRDGGTWTRTFGSDDPVQFIFGSRLAETLTGGSENNIIYGYQLADSLSGGDGNDTLWGGEDNDTLSGGEGDDVLYGNEGSDLLTGGNGSDSFVLGGDEGTDTIADFTDGEDRLGLWRGLTFPDLTILESGSNVQISITDTGETLAIIAGAAASSIDANDFVVLPSERNLEPPPEPENVGAEPPEGDEAGNLQVVQGFLDSIETGTFSDYIDNNFTEDVEYIIIRPDIAYFERGFAHEENALHPPTGPKLGIEEAKEHLLGLTAEYSIVELNPETFVPEGDNMAVFGKTTYQNNRTGQIAEDIPFSINIKLVDGKIDFYHFFEDTYTFLAASRDGIATWRRNYGEDENGNPLPPLDITFGTRLEDALTGGDEADAIYGYQLNDNIDGGAGSDNLWAGSGDDTVTGGPGDDLLYGNEGNDTLNGGLGNDFLNGNQGDDTIKGGEGNDTLRGGKDNDLLLGCSGDDLAWGDLGNDTIEGGEGNDTLNGSSGTDSLTGENGDDFLNGNEDNDTLDGGAGNDTLRGGKQSDTITGGNGDDWIWGDLGNDSLSGGAGSDRFVLASGAGSDVIADFTDGQDFIAFAGGLTASQVAVVPIVGGVEIRVGGETLATINNISAAQITTDSDLLFV